MKNFTDFTNDTRKAAERIIAIDALMEELAAEKAALTEQVINAFETYGHDYKVAGKSTYRVATVRRKGEAVPLVYRLTVNKGRVNTKALYAAYGITEAILNKYRGDDYKTRSIAEATDTQRKELGL